MLTNSFCANSDSTDWRDKEYFRGSRNLPNRDLARRRKAGDCGGQLGHVDIDVTQNVYVLLGFAFRFVPSCFGFMISSGAELFLR